MTLGIAASSSIRKVSALERRAGASSERNIAAPSPSGVEISRARNDVTTVPKMNGNAPKSSVTGFHWEEVRNPQPNLWRDSAELAQSWCTSSTATIRMLAAKAKATQRAIASPEIG